MPDVPNFCDCCAQPGGCSVFCEAIFCPCVVFGQNVAALKEYKDNSNACMIAAAVYAALWLGVPGVGGCCAAAGAAGSTSGGTSSMIACAHVLAGWANNKARGANAGDFGGLCAAVCCPICSLVQARNYEERVAKETPKSVGAGNEMQPPRRKRIKL